MTNQLRGRLRPYACRVLLGALLALGVVNALGASPTGNTPLAGLMMTLLLVAAAFFLGQRRALFWWALVLGLPDIVLRWSSLAFDAPPLLDQISTISAVPFSAVLIAALGSHVFRRDEPVDVDRIAGAIAIYLLLALAFAHTYALLLHHDPRAFWLDPAGTGRSAISTADLLYFSVSTLTTVGFGDITPVSRIARLVVMVEAVAGVMFVAVLVARLVTVYRGTAPSAPKEAASE